jgi:non-ribosomal peptide synthase protein (TIGR01720 family)
MAYWSKLAGEQVQRIPFDRPIDKSKQVYEYSERIILELEKEDTTKLLTEVNRAYNTEINDILLTASGMALKQWRNIEKTFINLESHGRQSIIEEIDINRTVGWFTAQYPFLLDVSAMKDIGHAIKNVKESLRRVPNKGIGYGILRFLVSKEELAISLDIEPEISFNYLGQFDAENPGEGYFSVSRLNTGGDISPQSERKYLIEISGMSASGRLSLSFIYNRLQYDEITITKLVEYYRSNLLDIIRHCTGKKENEQTPGDIAVDEDLSIEEFERIKEFVRENIEE